MNSIVFDILGEVEWLTYLLAVGLCVIIPLSAHFMGINLRRESPLESPKAALKAVSFLLTVLAVLIAIAYLRERFVAGSESAEILGIEMDPRMVTIVFLSINILIFVVATIASYMAHLDVTDAQLRDSDITQREMSDVEDDFNKKASIIARLERRRDQVEELKTRLHVKRDKLFGRHKERAETQRELADWLIRVYRHSNLRVRSKPDLPLSFKSEPELDISPFDVELNIECGQEDKNVL